MVSRTRLIVSRRFRVKNVRNVRDSRRVNVRVLGSRLRLLGRAVYFVGLNLILQSGLSIRSSGRVFGSSLWVHRTRLLFTMSIADSLPLTLISVINDSFWILFSRVVS